MPVLRRGRGNNKQEVAAVQQQLAAAGLYKGNIDGIFGRQTEAAVRAFQAKNGLSKDGRVGPNTMAALGQPATPVPTAKPAQRYKDQTLDADISALPPAENIAPAGTTTPTPGFDPLAGVRTAPVAGAQSNVASGEGATGLSSKYLSPDMSSLLGSPATFGGKSETSTPAAGTTTKPLNDSEIGSLIGGTYGKPETTQNVFTPDAKQPQQPSLGSNTPQNIEELSAKLRDFQGAVARLQENPPESEQATIRQRMDDALNDPNFLAALSHVLPSIQTFLGVPAEYVSGNVPLSELERTRLKQHAVQRAAEGQQPPIVEQPTESTQIPASQMNDAQLKQLMEDSARETEALRARTLELQREHAQRMRNTK